MNLSAVTSFLLFIVVWALAVVTTAGFSSGRGATPKPPLLLVGGPPCYLVIEAKLKSSEFKRFGEYASKVPFLVEKFGGEYLVLKGLHEPLEGDWDDETKIVLQKWPNATTAKEFWNSDEYQEVKKLREGTGDFRIMLVEGLQKEDLPEE